MDMMAVLEHVRFTKLTQEQFFKFMNLEQLQPFIDGPYRVKSLENGRAYHDGPMALATRKSGKHSFS